MELASRFFRLPERSCFLLGPRGTGKSTWLRHVLPDALHLDLLDPALRWRLRARPERLRALADGAPDRGTVVVGEIQRAPELLPVVRALLEQPRPRRFVLTASSARALRRGGADGLAERVAHRALHPFLAAELPAFDLERALRFGLLPLAAAADDPAAALDAYAGLHLDRAVQAEGMVRNAGDFARFLEAAGRSHGALLNVAAVARECAVERKTAAGYVGVLEDLLLAFRLPVFRRRAGRRTVARDKFYLFDAGVFRALRPAEPPDRPEEIESRALEGLVAQHLRAWAAYSAPGATVHFWRTQSGSEVDFVVHGEETGLQAFQVENAARVRLGDLRGLRTFRQDYPEAEAALLHRGRERLRVDGIWCLPVDAFLRRIVPHQPLLGWLRPAPPRSPP